VAPYDPSRPLIIDPVLVYSTYLGGSNTDRGISIALDGAGNAYVTGDTDSTDFPTTAGAQTTSSGGFDVFVAKLNATGTALGYSTYLGSGGDAWGIAVDRAGSAHVTGATESTFLPTTPGAVQPSHGGFVDGFVMKLDATGSVRLYSTYLGGGIWDSGGDIAVDGVGSAYVMGSTESTNLPTTSGAVQTTLANRLDAFVTKLNSTGTALVYSTYLGGSSDDYGQGLAVDGAGAAYVTGLTFSTDFPTTSGAAQTIHAGGWEAFVAKIATLPTSIDECKNGGWKTFGVFKNQGDCVSFVVTKGRNPPSGR
jgi:hypothetical protein